MAAHVRTGHGRGLRLRRSAGRANQVGLAPVLDVEHGVVAGAVGVPRRGRVLDGELLRQAMALRDRMPGDTFLCLPVAWPSLRDAAVRAELLRPSELRGVVVELVGIVPGSAEPGLSAVASSIQDAGGLIAVAAEEIWHPDFRGVTERAPRVVIVREPWLRDIERSERRRAVIEALRAVAAERDAWVMAEGVSTAAGFHALAELGVPLVSGSVVGAPDFAGWPEVAPSLAATLAEWVPGMSGSMRDLLVAVPTVRTIGDAAAAAVGSTHFAGAAVVLDADGRPVGLARRTEGGVRATEAVLCVHVDAEWSDVSARAREHRVSGDPLLAVDSAGRFLGVIPVDLLGG